MRQRRDRWETKIEREGEREGSRKREKDIAKT